MTTSRTPSRGGSPRRQAGLAALGLVAVLLMGCATSLATGWLRSQVDARASLVAARTQSLRQAERALAFFAANHARLPCPAATPAGPEDCGLNGTGWLPSGTLGGAGGVGASDVVTVRYERHEPRRTDGTAGAGAVPGMKDDSAWSAVPAADGYDLCADAGVGASIDAGGGFENAIGHDALQAALECASALASLDALAVGAGWVEPALDLQASNRKKADALADVMRMLITHRTFELDLAVLDLGAGVHALLDNQAKLQAAIAATLAGFPPPADAVPTFVAGIASASQALRLNALDIPRAAVSLALDAATLERYRAAARQALQARPWRGQDRILVQVRELGLGARAGRALGAGPEPDDASDSVH